MEISKKSLFHLSIFTLVGMSALGVALINFFHNRPLKEVLFKAEHPVAAIFIGLGLGLVAALLGILLVQAPLLKPVKLFFGGLMKQINPSFGHILFYSFCAGVGEEVLFRAGIQPLIGIWVTSIVFVALHGYLNPFNLPMSIYGLFLIFVAFGLGTLYILIGLEAAIAAHFMYDLVMFQWLRRVGNNIPDEVLPPLEVED